MFRKTSKKTESAVLNNAVKKVIPSILSQELHILGNLISDGHVDIDGSIEGNIKAEQATIRSHGKVCGDVIAEVVHVYGQVHGLIRAKSVHLYNSCHVEGVIMHQSLTVEDGAFVDAKFKRQGKTDATFSSPAFADAEDPFMESHPLPGKLKLIS